MNRDERYYQDQYDLRENYFLPEYDMHHTGDPRLDEEYGQQMSDYVIPSDLRAFLTYFQKAVNDQNVAEIQNAYENGFNQLTDSYFQKTPWPDAEMITSVVGHDEIFLILYRELFYRHVYARVQSGPTIRQRMESYYNYCSLFNLILNADKPISLKLPNQWLWDIIDEFIYQFQSFCQYRAKLQKKTQEEIDLLVGSPKVWNVHSVLNVLYSLVEKSHINEQLELYARGGEPDSVAGNYGRNQLYKMLGYFSLIGLLRLHCLLADYYLALKVVENVDINRKIVVTFMPPACIVTMYYYIGFTYMMMRRYQDSIRTFVNVLLYIQRSKEMNQGRTMLVDQFAKQTEQIYTLLGITLSLHPMRIDETVHSQLREKCGDFMQRLTKGDYAELPSKFGYSCPKFLSPVAPDVDGEKLNYHKDPSDQQYKVFEQELMEQQLLPVIRSYLKLYTTMEISKLARFMDMKEDDLRHALMSFKHKMQNVVWSKATSGLEGEFQSASEVDFYIDKDMIHIADTKVARRYGDFFIRQIHKFQELNETLSKLPIQ